MFASAYSGFPVELAGVVELHAAFLNESRTRGCWWCPVQEIRIHGPKKTGRSPGRSPFQRFCSAAKATGAGKAPRAWSGKMVYPFSSGEERMPAPLVAEAQSMVGVCIPPPGREASVATLVGW